MLNFDTYVGFTPEFKKSMEDETHKQYRKYIDNYIRDRKGGLLLLGTHGEDYVLINLKAEIVCTYPKEFMELI